MSIGVRQLLLLVATVVFLIAIFVDRMNWTPWASIGLACWAGAALASFDEATHLEMELLVGAGWTPLEALHAGTLAAARSIGLAVAQDHEGTDRRPAAS